MKRVLIVGAGGFGRELLAWCRHDPAHGKDWQIAGFLDDNPDALKGYGKKAGIVGKITDYHPQPGEELLCAIGQPAVKRRVVESLLAAGAVFRGYRHPSVILGDNVLLGRGVVLCPGVILTSDIMLGDYVLFNCHASAGHDVKVGAYSTVSGHCDLTGFVSLGEGTFLGSRATIIPSKKVGNGATVGAGAVVITNVPPGITVFGNPARRLS